MIYKVFTKRDTNALKGIAILFMVLHHSKGLFYERFDPSWYCANSSGTLPFVTGIVLAKTDALTRLMSKRGAAATLITSASLAAAFALRLLFSQLADLFFALALTAFYICVISRPKVLSGVLAFFGTYSANIWLLHTTVIAVIRRFLTLPSAVLFIAAFCLTLAVSVMIEKLKLVSGYSKFISNMRKKATG